MRFDGNSKKLKTYKVYLKGFYGLYNFGDDLILLSIVNFIKNHLKGFGRITLFLDFRLGSYLKLVEDADWIELKGVKLVRGRYKTLDRLIMNAMGILNSSRRIPEVLKKFLIILLLSTLFIYKFFTYFLVKLGYEDGYLNLCKNVNVIHYIGGGYLNENWPEYIIGEAVELYFIKKMNPNVKIIATGQSIGPFKSHLYFSMLRKFIQFLDTIYVREPFSLHLLKKVNFERVVLGFDDVILLYKRLLSIRKMSVKKYPKAGINLKNFRDHNKFYLKLKGEIFHLIESLIEDGYELNMFCFGRNPGPDDYKIAKIMGIDLSKIKVHNPYNDLRSFMESLLNSDVNFGFAYHFTVLSLIMSIPVFSYYLGEYYKQKILGILKVYSLEDICHNAKNITYGLKFMRDLLSKEKEKIKRVMELKTEKIYRKTMESYLASYRELFEKISQKF